MAKGFFDIQDIKAIDFGALMKMLPGNRSWMPFSTQGAYITAILRSQRTLEKYDINSALRLAHFFGQGLIETGFLRYKAENLNYSADGLQKVFGKYFPTRKEAEAYARKPEKIANRVYANRMGNGDEASGDGWRYRGRGFFQLTGKNNYRRYGEMAGIDLVKNPSIIEKDLRKSIQVAAAFFGKTGLVNYADDNNARAVSRGVNRGQPESRYPAHGEAERIVWTRRALALVQDPDQVVSNSTAQPVDDGVLEVGDSGPAVFELQEMLADLGYPVGGADGVFGQQTRRAVLAFQDEYGMSPTGSADEQTMDVLRAAMDDPRDARSVTQEAVTAEDLRRQGAKDVHRTGQAGNAGAAGSVVAGGAAANEAGVVEQGIEVVRDALAEAEAATDETAGEAPEETGADNEPSEPASEAPTEETAGDADTVEESPGAEGPIEEASAEETPADDPPVKEASDGPDLDETAADPLPPVSEVPVEEVPAEEAPAVPAAEELTPTVAQPSAPPPEMTTDPDETDWTTVAIFGAIVIIGLFIFIRSRQSVDSRVDEARYTR